MKKILLIFVSICSLLCIKNNLFSEENKNIVITEEKLITQAPPESYPVPYQPEYKPAFIKMFLILFALIVLIFLTFWIFKRFMGARLQQANLTKSIKILEKRAISPKSILYLIEVEGKKIVISESNLEVRKVRDLD